MLILMAYGPFRFSMAGFGYEELKRRAEARIESVKIVGGRPSLHRMGLDDETTSIRATFFPNHLPGNVGLSQVGAMRAALGQTYPMIGNRLGIGDALGSWALKGIEDTQTEIGFDGGGQQVEVGLELIYDGRSRSLGAASALLRLLG